MSSRAAQPVAQLEVHLLVAVGDRWLHARLGGLQVLLVDLGRRAGCGRDLQALLEREHRRLTQQSGQVRAAKALQRRVFGQRVQARVLGERDAARERLQDRGATHGVGQGHVQDLVQTSGPQQRRVDDVRAVRRRDEKHACAPVDAVHFREELRGS